MSIEPQHIDDARIAENHAPGGTRRKQIAPFRHGHLALDLSIARTFVQIGSFSIRELYAFPVTIDQVPEFGDSPTPSAMRAMIN